MSRGLRAAALAAAVLAQGVVAGAATGDDARALMAAAKRGDRAAVSRLLRTVKVNTRAGDGSTALAWATYADDAPLVDQLLRAGADPNLLNDYGVGPLALACGNGNDALVQRLLTAGARPNVPRASGETPLMTCASHGAVGGVRALLNAGADVNAAEASEGQTALMWAAAARQPRIVTTLIELGAKVDARSAVIPYPEPFVVSPSVSAYNRNYPPHVRFRTATGGFTPLLFAAQQGDVSTVEALLARGADVNDRTPEEGSALILAIASGHEALATYLLEHGADPNASDAWGLTPLHYALHGGLQNFAGMQSTPSDRLGWLRTNMPRLVKLLLDKGANPNAAVRHSLPFLDHDFIGRTTEDFPQVDMTGATPFLFAAISGDAESMRLLLDRGADPRVQTVEGVHALMLAAGLGTERGKGSEKRYLEAARIAQSLGLTINQAKDDGRTALHAAVVLGWQEMVRFLVKNGASLTAKDTYGQTALTIAMGDPEDRIYRPLRGGNNDDRFRVPRENKRMTALLLELGAPPFTGKYADKSAR